ncbi:MAG: hypothetical protein N3E46_03090 [Gemmataceae bacterium]|jgi:hypothetical protein|nr:hypothetical protein [Gemmataceae bacterium]
MVKLPIIICSSGDINIYDSIDEAARSMESIDVLEGEYVVFDSEGYVLELYVDDRDKPWAPKWLWWLLGVPIGPVEIRGRKEAEPRERELCSRIIEFLTALQKLGIVRADLEWLSTASLSELIDAVRDPRRLNR